MEPAMVNAMPENLKMELGWALRLGAGDVKGGGVIPRRAAERWPWKPLAACRVQRP